MATRTIGRQAARAAPKETYGLWEKVREFASSVAHEAEPFFGPLGLDFLDEHGQSRLSTREKSYLDGEMRR